MLTNELQNLVLQHMPFAEKIAKNQFKKTPPQISLDELKAAAYLGLVDAATRYNGVSDFKAFSAWRISGEIKDYLRSLKWNNIDKKVTSFPENYDIAVEEDADNFEEFLDDISKKRLSPLAKNIIRMYYGEQLPIVKIAKQVNLSGARVSQLLKSNVEILKNACA